jgi:hypothetical protein
MREATPTQAIEKAADIGQATEQVVRSLIEKSRHPLMYLRRTQGILRLAKRYSPKALERACQKLLSIGSGSPRLADVEGIIKADAGLEASNIIPIKRQPNPFLRGQESWRL